MELHLAGLIDEWTEREQKKRQKRHSLYKRGP
jgi:hypothetical protein